MWIASRASAIVVAMALLGSPAIGAAQAAGGAQSRPRPSAGTAPRAAKAKAAPASVAALLKKAAAAREAHRLDEALALYQRVARQQPRNFDAQWWIGAINYDLERYDAARAAFDRAGALQPSNGAIWAFKGICEFKLQHYDVALRDLLRASDLKRDAPQEIISTARYHTAILLSRIEEYEQALQRLSEFANEGNDSPQVIEALGIALLRLPVLPSELPGDKREAVMMAGRAGYFAAARMPDAANTAFQALVSRFPEMPNVHYAYGVFLLSERPDDGLKMMEQELTISPEHAWARLQMAFEYIKRSDFAAAKPYAEEAVARAPDLFVAHKALGQVLLETGDTDGAVRELELAVKQAPTSPSVRFLMARAYRRAGRSADADREQGEFARLDRMVRTERSGPQSVGGMEMQPAGGPNPQR